MFRALNGIVIAVVCALLIPKPAQAITVTLDDYALTVVRPLTGTTQVDFTGHIAVTDGYEAELVTMSPLYNESGDSLSRSLFPELAGNLDGVLFSLIVGATDALGTYAFFAPPTELAFMNWFECPKGGGQCNGSGPIYYSLNVVAAAVPEPTTLALFGLGLVPLLLRIRRREG